MSKREGFGQDATVEEKTNCGIVLSVTNISRIASSCPQELKNVELC
jgi:hypothetical protein